MVLGIDYDSSDAYIRSRWATRYNDYSGTSSSNALKSKEQQGDTFLGRVLGDVGSGNTCTDGNDDGHVGLLPAVGNIAQGAIRTIPNMIKGMFTDGEGKFSLLKTAGTIALGAACVAFPAVGLAVCGIGAVTGGIKVVSNVSKAMSADTDAEAKAAWEEVGSGGVTTALSVAGAKASYGAMKATSTASEVGASALDSLEENATFGQRLTALKEDAVSSTRNNFTNLKQLAMDTVSKQKEINSEVKELKELQTAKNQAVKKQNAGETLTTEEQAAIDKWDSLSAEDYSAKAYSRLQKINEKTGIKEELAEMKSKLTEAKKSGDKEAVEAIRQSMQDYKSEYSPITKTLNTAKENISGYVKQLKDIKNLRSNLSKEKLAEAAKSLGTNGKQIVNDIMSKELPELIDDYGYDNLGEIITTITGAIATDRSM